MAYKSEKNHKKAAASPKQREMPFSMEEQFRYAAGIRNDPVGSEVYKADPYSQDKRENWIDRS